MLIKITKDSFTFFNITPATVVNNMKRGSNSVASSLNR